MEAFLTEIFTILNDHRKALLKITNKRFKLRFSKTWINSKDYQWNNQTQKDYTNYNNLIKRRKASTMKTLNHWRKKLNKTLKGG